MILAIFFAFPLRLPFAPSQNHLHQSRSGPKGVWTGPHGTAHERTRAHTCAHFRYTWGGLGRACEHPGGCKGGSRGHRAVCKTLPAHTSARFRTHPVTGSLGHPPGAPHKKHTEATQPVQVNTRPFQRRTFALQLVFDDFCSSLVLSAFSEAVSGSLWV